MVIKQFAWASISHAWVDGGNVILRKTSVESDDDGEITVVVTEQEGAAAEREASRYLAEMERVRLEHTGSGHS